MPYDKGLDPTTPEFSSYVNNSYKGWENIGKEMDYFIAFQNSSLEHERTDAKGYLLTCMFKIAAALKDGKNVELSDEAKKFLGCDLAVKSLVSKIVEYGKEIIKEHSDEESAAALSSVASTYGVMAYMVHKGLLRDEEIAPNQEPQKFFSEMPSDKIQENTRKNIALAMENFEESAQRGNVRSMGSIVMWAEQSGHPDFYELNNYWTKKAANAEMPNPNSQIDYGKMLLDEERNDEAKEFFQKAASYGLDKAKLALERVNIAEEDSWAAKVRQEKKSRSNFQQKSEVTMRQDVYNATFAALDINDIENIEIKTNSRDKEFLTGRVLESEVDVIDENGEVVQGSVKVASTMLSYENLTRPIAAALLSDEKKDGKGNFFTEREWKENGEKKIDRQLIDKMDELAQSHSKEELILMRNDLEEIRKKNPNFAENSAEFEKLYSEKYQVPSTNFSEVSGAEKLSQKRKIEEIMSDDSDGDNRENKKPRSDQSR